jgi:hypothetical protein
VLRGPIRPPRSRWRGGEESIPPEQGAVCSLPISGGVQGLGS